MSPKCDSVKCRVPRLRKQGDFPWTWIWELGLGLGVDNKITYFKIYVAIIVCVIFRKNLVHKHVGFGSRKN